jgi:hypothetical protein
MCQMPTSAFLRAACLQGVLLVGLGGSVCAQPDETSAKFTIQPKLFDCSPKVLRAGQSVTLTLSGVHGRNLAIERLSDKSWHFIVVGLPDPGSKPLMTPDAYEKARRLVLPPNVVGILGNKDPRVFTKPGRYTVYTSENLESEEPGYRCEIRYAG